MEKSLIAKFETYAREPILRKMNDGTLVCTFLTGGDNEPENNNYVSYSKSYDDGKTWTEPKILFEHTKRGVWCTEIFTEWEYPVAFIHTYSASCNTHYRELLTYYSESRDNGETWSEPKTVPGHINGCSVRQGITLSNGDTMFPIYWQECVQNFEYMWVYNFQKANWKFRCGAGVLPKGEKYFQRFGYIANDDLELWEPNAVEIENGHIIMYIRTNTGFLHYSESFDYGRTWGELKKMDIPHSDTKITCLKVKDTVLLINNSVTTGRTNLEITKSKDGINFEHICFIQDKEDRFFYPHAFADDEKKILYVAYENAKEHFLGKFTYEELGI